MTEIPDLLEGDIRKAYTQLQSVGAAIVSKVTGTFGRGGDFINPRDLNRGGRDVILSIGLHTEESYKNMIGMWKDGDKDQLCIDFLDEVNQYRSSQEKKHYQSILDMVNIDRDSAADPNAFDYPEDGITNSLIGIAHMLQKRFNPDSEFSGESFATSVNLLSKILNNENVLSFLEGLYEEKKESGLDNTPALVHAFNRFVQDHLKRILALVDSDRGLAHKVSQDIDDIVQSYDFKGIAIDEDEWESVQKMFGMSRKPFKEEDIDYVNNIKDKNPDLIKSIAIASHLARLRAEVLVTEELKSQFSINFLGTIFEIVNGDIVSTDKYVDTFANNILMMLASNCREDVVNPEDISRENFEQAIKDFVDFGGFKQHVPIVGSDNFGKPGHLKSIEVITCPGRRVAVQVAKVAAEVYGDLRSAA
jgi:hypothetical protein